jgi:hypothetical protein
VDGADHDRGADDALPHGLLPKTERGTVTVVASAHAPTRLGAPLWCDWGWGRCTRSPSNRCPPRKPAKHCRDSVCRQVLQIAAHSTPLRHGRTQRLEPDPPRPRPAGRGHAVARLFGLPRPA